MLAAPVDGFLGILCFITIENDIIYNLTVNQNIITRYVKVMQTFTAIFHTFYAHLSTLSDITLVFELITFWFMADLRIVIYSFI